MGCARGVALDGGVVGVVSQCVLQSYTNTLYKTLHVLDLFCHCPRVAVMLEPDVQKCWDVCVEDGLMSKGCRLTSAHYFVKGGGRTIQLRG